LHQFKNPRIQRLVERYANISPGIVGLASTSYGIICTFDKLNSPNPQPSIAPCILDVLVFTGIALVIELLALFVWDWLSDSH
jgi:hypothetical protein